MTDAVEQLYQIQYDDNTYRMIDLTDDEFNTIGGHMMADKAVVVMPKGILKLTQVRAIVLIPPVPEPEEKEKDGTPKEGQLTEWGFVDGDTAQWLKDQGIDIVNGGSAK